MNNLFGGGGNTLALLEEIRQLKQKISELENKQLKFVIKSVACTFSSGYTALNYSDLGVFRWVFKCICTGSIWKKSPGNINNIYNPSSS